jgi:uncharacterized protein YggU (UPF0235/DUF167 family)
LSAIRRDGDDWLLDCWLQPRGGRDAVIGLHDGALPASLAGFIAGA